MSEIRATTISDAAGTGPITLTGQSAAKAWTNYDGPNATIKTSLNTSSVTDNSTGNFDFNYTNSFSGNSNNNGIAGILCSGNIGEGLKCSNSTGSALKVRTYNASITLTDRHINVTNHGDLA